MGCERNKSKGAPRSPLGQAPELTAFIRIRRLGGMEPVPDRRPAEPGVLNRLMSAWGSVLVAIARWAWWRGRAPFAGLSLLTKGFVVVLGFLALAWVARSLSLHGISDELSQIAIAAVSVLFAVAVIRHLFTRFTRKSKYGSWTGR
jgi:hypothetical protein